MANKQYLLRDNNEIFGIYPDLDVALTSMLQFIYIGIKNGSTLENECKTYNIYEYEYNCVKSVINLNNHLTCFINSVTEYVSTNHSVNNYINRILDRNPNMNIFIPVNRNDDSDSDSDNEGTDNNQREEQELIAKLNILNNMKNEEQRKLEELIIKQNMMEISNKTFENNMKQRQEEMKKQQKQKFLSDLKTYKIFKQEILDLKRDPNNISHIFEKEYKTFKYLDDNNLLNESKTEDELFELFISNFEKNDKFNGEFTSIYDNETFEDLKQQFVDYENENKNNENDTFEDYIDKCMDNENLAPKINVLQDMWYLDMNDDMTNYKSFKEWLLLNNYNLETFDKNTE